MQAIRFLIAVVALCCLFQDGQAVQQTWRMGLIGEGSTIIGKAGTIGQQLIFDCEVTRNGKKFERYGWCSTVQIDSKRGSWMLCTMETYFPEGSVMNQVGHEGYGIGTLMLSTILHATVSLMCRVLSSSRTWFSKVPRPLSAVLESTLAPLGTRLFSKT
jgi:hypothetical protein